MYLDQNHFLYNYVNYSQIQIIVSITIIIIGFSFRKNIVTLFGVVLLLFFLYFFRNCQQEIDTCHVVSPSQSKITKIIPNVDPYSKNSGNYTCIKTYISPFDRHYLVSPVDGVIINIENYERKNDLENIRMTIKDKYNNLLYFDQIVKKFGHWGFLFKIFVNKRVIVSKEIGDKIKKGDHYGIIRFGSMMRFYIPSDYTLSVKVGDKLNQGSCLVNFS